MPERFGRQRKYALWQNQRKANIENNLAQLGIKPSDEDPKNAAHHRTGW